MRHSIRRAAVCLLAGILLWAAHPADSRAAAPYDTYTRDPFGRAVRTPPAYEPAAVIGRDIYLPDAGGEMKYSPLKSPQDLFVDRTGRIFVADTDNDRIVEFDQGGRFVRAIAPAGDPLKGPRGIFAAPDGSLYVADTGNRRIVEVDREGRVVRSFGRPEKGLPEEAAFEPTNLVVDNRGYLYVVLNGSYQGIMMLDSEGKFRGYYGTNYTEAGWMDRLRRMLYTKEQLSRQVRLLPATIRSIDIDALGYVYTVSGSSSDQVKKLNIRGDNLWGGRQFGEDVPGAEEAPAAAGRLLADIAVDGQGNATLIDKTGNVVLQYDSDGRLLFYWAGRMTAGMPKVGLNQSPSAVAVNARNELLVLDDSLNVVQVFRPTRFGAAVHQAHALMRDGKYRESRPLWEEVAKLDALYSPAYEGLAEAAYYEGDYAEALRLYRLAGDSAGYSEAFWQLRLAWFQSRFPWIANAFVALFLLLAAAGRFRVFAKLRRRLPDTRPRSWKLPGQLKHAFVILRHPLDGFGDLRYGGKGSWASGIILLAAAAATILARTYYTGFAFDPVPAEQRSSAAPVVVFLSVWLSWVVCNYLIGSIYRGEARFRDVFAGSAYALFPSVLLGLPLAFLSNAMTNSESSIYHALGGGIVAWCGLLFFWNIQSLQNYGFGETVVNVLLTAASTVMLWVLLFILFGLSTDLRHFLQSIYLEVST